MPEQTYGSSIDALHGLRRLLQYHQAMGIADYPLHAEVRHFLKVTSGSATRKVQSARGGTAVSPAPAAMPAEAGDGPALLASLGSEIRQCSLCRLAVGATCRVPGLGAAGSRLLVVGDWSLQGQGCDPATLFGPEEDRMLWKMMEAIALPPEEVYVTNILKCCPGAREVDQGCRQSCFSYLLREIAAVRPQLICAMGEVAATMLVGSSEPLFRLRGRFSMFRYQGMEQISVMPTFHPSYLLRNPEMKKATWNDLQAIRRRLDQAAKSPRA